MGSTRARAVAAMWILGLWPETVAQGSAPGPTTCTVVFDEVASPGLRAAPSSGTVSTNGDGGLVECDGPVDGRQPAGAGSSNVSGRYGTRGGDSCRSGGAGDDVQDMTIPTAAGAEHVRNMVTFAYGALRGGVLSGEFRGDRMSGTFTAKPYRVTSCGTTPMTRFRVWEKGTFH
jgi:hypothetical protein